jgi:hypothetical protein
MGLFDQLVSAMGGQEPIDRFARGRADFDRPDSRDFQHWNQLVGSAPPEDLERSFSQAAREVDPNEYDEHITPGVRGTDPLGGLGGPALGALAGALLGNLSRRGGTDVTRMVPGLRTTDPYGMNQHEVASLASWMRRHDPDAFGRAAAQVGRQEPGLLQSLLGNKAMLLAGAALAAKFMNSRMHDR